jgi:DNA-binding winged helix-turn-helix (wHTH) protein
MRYLFEEYTFDIDRRELHRGADLVSIAPQVFDLLDYLIRSRDRVVSKDELISAIWGGRIITDAALATRLNALRVAIGDTGEEQRLIKRCRGRAFGLSGRFLKLLNRTMLQSHTALFKLRQKLPDCPVSPPLP